MFNLSFSEILIVLIIALFVIKPEDLPKIIFKIRSFIDKIKKHYRNISQNIENQININDLEIKGQDNEYHKAYDLSDMYQDFNKNALISESLKTKDEIKQNEK